jgi:hypothetical protein
VFIILQLNALILGRPPVLPPKVEEKVVNLATEAAEKGLGVSPRMLRAKTSQLVKRLNIHTPFRQGIPGKDWYRGLRNRHPEIVIRHQEKLSQQSSHVKP